MGVTQGPAHFKKEKKKMAKAEHEKSIEKILKEAKASVKKEVKKCQSNFKYFCHTHMKIDHPKRGRIDYHPYDYQIRCVNDFGMNRFNIIRKCRQLGLSTTTAIYVLWKCMFNEGYEVVVISKSQREAKNFLRKIKTAFHAMKDERIRGKLVTDSVTEMEFENGSKINSVPSSAGRSFAASLLVLDEAAFCRNIDELWAECYPTLSTGGDCVVISTVNGTSGKGKWFFETWRDAEAGENDFNAIRLKWSDNPDFTEEWLEMQFRQLKARRFKQEILGIFHGSGDAFFQPQVLESVEADIQDPKWKKEHDKLWIWQGPMRGKLYGMAVDTGSGDASDFSCFQIFDLQTFEQVAEFRTKTNTDKFTRIVDKWAKIYNNAYIIVERNSMGQAVADNLWFRIGYQNMFCVKKNKPGWVTSSKTRHYIVAAIENSFVEKIVKVKSVRTLRELQTFVIKDNGKVEHDNGANDDLLFSIGILVHNRQKMLSAMPLGMKQAAIQDVHESMSAFMESSGVLKPTFTGDSPQDIGWLFDKKR